MSRQILNIQAITIHYKKEKNVINFHSQNNYCVKYFIIILTLKNLNNNIYNNANTILLKSNILNLNNHFLGFESIKNTSISFAIKCAFPPLNSFLLVILIYEVGA